MGFKRMPKLDAYAKTVSFKVFKKNAIVAQLHPDTQIKEWEKATGKKVKSNEGAL